MWMLLVWPLLVWGYEILTYATFQPLTNGLKLAFIGPEFFDQMIVASLLIYIAFAIIYALRYQFANAKIHVVSILGLGALSMILALILGFLFPSNPLTIIADSIRQSSVWVTLTTFGYQQGYLR